MIVKTVFDYKETHAFVITDEKYYPEAVKGMLLSREQIEEEINVNKLFLTSRKPIGCITDSETCKKMSRAVKSAGVGPMAAVAGAIADAGVAKTLVSGSSHTVIENGGDISLAVDKPCVVGIWAPTSEFQNMAFEIEAGSRMGICSSSGLFGHSFSYGKCDLATVVGTDGCTTDAFATALANTIKAEKDLEAAFSILEGKNEVWGALAIKGKNVALYGDLPKIVRYKDRGSTL